MLAVISVGVTPVAMGSMVAGSLMLMVALCGMGLWFRWMLRRSGHPLPVPPYVSALRNLPWSGADVLLLGVCITSVVLLVTLASVLLRQLDPNGNLAGRATALQSSLLQGTVALALLVLVRRSGLGFRGCFQTPSAPGVAEQGRRALRYYLMLIPAVMTSVLLWRAGLRLLGVPGTYQPIVALFSEGGGSVWMRVWLVGAAVLGAPIVEEAVFRGLLLPVLLRRYHWAQAVLLVSALFAAVHVHLSSMVPLFVASLGFSLAYLYSGSLLVPIVMHALFNGVNLAVLFLMIT